MGYGSGPCGTGLRITSPRPCGTYLRIEGLQVLDLVAQVIDIEGLQVPDLVGQVLY